MGNDPAVSELIKTLANCSSIPWSSRRRGIVQIHGDGVGGHAKVVLAGLRRNSPVDHAICTGAVGYGIQPRNRTKQAVHIGRAQLRFT